MFKHDQRDWLGQMKYDCILDESKQIQRCLRRFIAALWN